MTDKEKTAAHQIADAQVQRDEAKHALHLAVGARTEAEKQVRLVKDQFDDLKRRLFESETELAKLRGYIARVREDDTVREELIKVGDPDAPTLTAKRKDLLHFAPVQNGETDFVLDSGDSYGYRERKTLRKHWIAY